MAYVDGCIIAVPTVDKDAYVVFAKKVAKFFKQHGALNIVECWGDETPPGKLTSFPKSVRCKDEETVVFAWMTWPSKDVRDAAHNKAPEDPIVKSLGAAPFDDNRMIFGGFEEVVAYKGDEAMAYVDGHVVAVPTANKEKYIAWAKIAAAIMKDCGAVAAMNCWGGFDVPPGELTSFPMAVQCKDDETVVFGWGAWPSKAARDAGHKKVMEDPRMKDYDPTLFDGERMLFGGFEVILNE